MTESDLLLGQDQQKESESLIRTLSTYSITTTLNAVTIFQFSISTQLAIVDANNECYSKQQKVYIYIYIYLYVHMRSLAKLNKEVKHCNYTQILCPQRYYYSP